MEKCMFCVTDDICAYVCMYVCVYGERERGWGLRGMRYERYIGKGLKRVARPGKLLITDCDNTYFLYFRLTKLPFIDLLFGFLIKTGSLMGTDQ